MEEYTPNVTEPKAPEGEVIDSTPPADSLNVKVELVPQDVYEYFDIKPEDTITIDEKTRLKRIYEAAISINQTTELGHLLMWMRLMENSMGTTDNRIFRMYRYLRVLSQTLEDQKKLASFHGG